MRITADTEEQARERFQALNPGLEIISISEAEPPAALGGIKNMIMNRIIPLLALCLLAVTFQSCSTYRLYVQAGIRNVKDTTIPDKVILYFETTDNGTSWVDHLKTFNYPQLLWVAQTYARKLDSCMAHTPISFQTFQEKIQRVQRIQSQESAMRRQMGVAAREQPGAFLIRSECQGGNFRLYLVCQRDISGNVGSIAVTLKAPSELAGSQLSGQQSPISDFHSDFQPQVADWWTGGQRVTWANSEETNRLYGSLLLQYYGALLTAPDSHTILIESGNGEHRTFKAGEEYTLATWRYPASWPDNCIVIETPANSSGYVEGVGGTTVSYLSISYQNEISGSE